MGFVKTLLQKAKFYWGSLFYLSYAPQAFRYSRWRDRVERQFASAPIRPGFDSPGKLIRAEATEQGAHFSFQQAELEITFLTPDLVCLTWQPGIAPIPYGIQQQTWPTVTATLTQEGENWRLASQQDDRSPLQITVCGDGAIIVWDREGNQIRQEMPPQYQAEGWLHQAILQPEEKIYGLGERSASLNRRIPREVKQKGKVKERSTSYRMWNYDAAGMYGLGSDPMYLGIPVYLGLHKQGSYLIFYENSWESTFRFDGDRAVADFSGGSLRYYLSVGQPRQLLERYTELTGRSPLPPRWSLGYHQSHWGYRNEAAIRQTYQCFEKFNLPLSAIHLDIDVQVGYRAFTIDPERFPDLGRFIRELLHHGVQFVTILNPGIKYNRYSNLFLEGQILNAFCKLPNGELVRGPVWPGWCVFPDFTDPIVRQWWSRQYEFLLDVGVAGFWHDMNEPAAFIFWGDRSLPKVTQHCLEGRGGDHREAHNLYGLLQAEAAYASLCRHRPQQRPFIVSRAGWAGLQRYAWTWTGDIECTWDALRVTIPMVISLGLSGIPYSGPDIGGFQGNPSAELYLRWFQMATFFPFYRTHSSNNVDDRNPWTYGEPTLSIIREFLYLRYRLLRYFYTLAWESAQKGYPLVRPLFWIEPENEGLWEREDSFLLGDSLMVCPGLEEGGRSREVMLPSGRWYDFWDQTVLEGPQVVTLSTPLERIPLLVKAGSILPMEEEKRLTLHLYPPATGSSQGKLYSDAGDGYGAWRLEEFRLERDEQGITLTWQQQGEFCFAYEQICIQTHGLAVQQAWVDDIPILCHNNSVTLNQPFQQLRFQEQV